MRIIPRVITSCHLRSDQCISINSIFTDCLNRSAAQPPASARHLVQTSPEALFPGRCDTSSCWHLSFSAGQQPDPDIQGPQIFHPLRAAGLGRFPASPGRGSSSLSLQLAKVLNPACQALRSLPRARAGASVMTASRDQ